MLTLATEDALSEALGERLVAESGGTLVVTQRLRGNGFGYLKSRMQSWRQMAQWTTVLLITDLDQAACPPELLQEWAGDTELPDGLLFRIAVREAESWLLADQSSLAPFLKISTNGFPDQPDELVDPKRTLLALAKRAPRAIRSDLVAENDDGSLRQGLGYNALLCEYVARKWDPVTASARSLSLARARKRLRELAELRQKRGRKNK